MPDISIRTTFNIHKVNFRYRHPKSSFNATMDSNGFGPTPGGILIPTTGIDIDVPDIDVPGWLIVDNYDATNYFTWGVYDPDFALFYPVGEVLPGEWYVSRLSRYLFEQFGAGELGSGSLGPSNNILKAYADTADIRGFIGVFER